MACSLAAANFFFILQSPGPSSPSFSSSRWAIFLIFTHEPCTRRAHLRAGRALGFNINGTLPRARRFKRLALIGLLAAVLRVVFGWQTTRIWPVAECAAAASGVMLLANFVLLFWRKEFPRQTDIVISPWTREFVQFLIVSAAYIIGSNLFIQGDLLIANKFFTKGEIDAYGSAGVLSRALATAVGPLLIVLFTHRLSRPHGDAMREQLKLLCLYTVALVSGAICLFVLRGFCLQLLHRNTPEAAAMIGRAG